MPSKHTVVVSLDDETERIVNDLGGNRSAWIRDAIKWRHGPGADLEVMIALAEARKRQINTVTRYAQQLVRNLRELEKPTYQSMHKRTLGAIENLEQWLELR